MSDCISLPSICRNCFVVLYAILKLVRREGFEPPWYGLRIRYISLSVIGAFENGELWTESNLVPRGNCFTGNRRDHPHLMAQLRKMSDCSFSVYSLTVNCLFDVLYAVLKNGRTRKNRTSIKAISAPHSTIELQSEIYVIMFSMNSFKIFDPCFVLGLCQGTRITL